MDLRHFPFVLTMHGVCRLPHKLRSLLFSTFPWASGCDAFRILHEEGDQIALALRGLYALTSSTLPTWQPIYIGMWGAAVAGASSTWRTR